MLPDPSLSTSLALFIEKTINKALQHDPATRTKLSELAGHSIEIATQAPNLQFFFILETDEIKVLSHCEETADVQLHGKATDFISLIGEDTHSLANTNISVSGKVGLLNQIKSALGGLDIDWEDMLADVVGLLPANAAANFGRSVFTWLNLQKKTIESQLPHYLSEELKAVPAAAELEIFYDAVDDIKSSTQRFEARLRRLQQSFNSSAENKSR